MGLVLGLPLSVVGIELVEQPRYTVLARHVQRSFEVRRYEDALVRASFTTTMNLPEGAEAREMQAEAWQSDAFRTLARYIGVFSVPENAGAAKAEPVAMTAPVLMEEKPEPVAMTAPVLMEEKPEPVAMTAPVLMEEKSEPVAMTAPVLMEEKPEPVAMTAPVLMEEKPEPVAMTAPVLMEEGSGEAGDRVTRTMAFLLPAKYTLKTAPRPTDPRVTLSQQPQRIVAVRMFSGRWNNERIEEEKRALLQALREDSVEIVEGAHVQFAGYNAPFTLPWFRRLEVMVDVVHKDSESEEARD